MNKRRLHHFWTKIRFLKPWYFLLVTLVFAVIAVFALRANNQHMLRLRTAVYSADQQNNDVQGALNRLQAYVTAHMNTNLSDGTSVYPPIQLKYTYDRLVQAQQAAGSTGNDQIYTDAQHYCEQQDSVDFSGHNRVPCIEQYVQSHGGTVVPDNGAQIPDSLYKFAFATPRWSPDLAGWSLVIAVISGLLGIAAFIADRWLRRI